MRSDRSREVGPAVGTRARSRRHAHRDPARSGPGVQQHHRVVVGVNDPRLRSDGLRHLVGVADLVVIYLGMSVNAARGVRTLISFGPKIRKSVEAQPDGLLLHENLLFSLFPPHAGMRQYWRDFDCLERWARSLPHRQWWQQFLRDRAAPALA